MAPILPKRDVEIYNALSKRRESSLVEQGWNVVLLGFHRLKTEGKLSKGIKKLVEGTADEVSKAKRGRVEL